MMKHRQNVDKLSKLLVYILGRHPDEFGLLPGENGYVKIKELMKSLGEEPAAIVHLVQGRTATEAELQEWVRARLANFKVPVKVLFSEESLPRNANGKILKRDLKSLF